MKRKLFVLMLTLLLVLTIALPAAFAGGSVFPTKFKVEEHMFDAGNIPNVNYNSLYVNSKGDVWKPMINNESKDQSVLWMYKIDIKNDTILKKVPIGESYFNILYKPSPDGRYLYFPTAKTHLVFGFHAIDSWYLACFDSEEGKVVWDKYIKKCNNGVRSLTSFTDYLPVQDGVIELFTNDDDTGHTTVYKTIVLKMSVKGDKLWDVTIPGKFGIVMSNKGNLLLSDGKKLLSLDTRTGIYEEEGKLSMEVNAPEPIANRGTPTFSGDTVYYVSKATDVKKEWRLYRFTRSNGKNELVEIVSHLPVRNDPCSVAHEELLFMSAVYDGYFVFIDSLGDFHDQNVYVYDKNGKLLWHIDVIPANPDRLTLVTPVFANGMFFYSTQSVMHAVDMKTGRDVYSVDLGNTIFDYVDAAEDNGTVWAVGTVVKDTTKNLAVTYLFKITEEKALLTVNTNVKDGSFDIIQKDKKETVKFGSKVELPPGNYTLHFHSLDGASGVKAPDDINISLKDNENKVLNVEYKDIEPPVITVEPISQPTAMGGVAYFTIKGTVKDNFSGVKSVSVNGTEVSIDKDGSFSKTVIVHEKGTVTFFISAEDNAGNRADKTLTADYNPPIVIRLKPNSKMFFVNETAKILDSPPVIIPKWNRTVVPIRAIVEALGGTVSWDPVQRMVTINLGDNMINLWIGKPQAMVNGVMKWIDDSNHDVKPIIINDRTMLPLRFVAENLGCKVDWNGTTRTITITYTP